MSKRRRGHDGRKTPRKGLAETRQKARTISSGALGALAVGWAICFMTLHGYQDRPPFAEEANIAWHIALGHGFRSPMDASPTAPPSAWSAPLYPFAIAGAYRLFGIRSTAAVSALMLLNAIFFGIIVVGTERLLTLLFRSQFPGLLAAVLLATHPLFLFYMADFWDGFMSLAIFVLLTLAAVQLGDVTGSGGRIGFGHTAALGVGMGLLALTNASYAISYPVLLYQAFRPPLAVVSRWRLAALASAVCLVVISPWTIRNYAAFGELIPIRTGGGIQFWIGNAPVSDGWLDAKAFAVHPYVNPVERRLLLTVGEPAYNDLAFQRFEQGLVASPLGYLGRCLRRSMYLLISEPTAPAEYPLLVNWEWYGVFWDGLFLNALVAILGVYGMVAARHFGYRQHRLPLLTATVALPFIATAVTDRYSLPLRWLLVVYSGAGIWMLSRWYRGKLPEPGRAAQRQNQQRLHGSPDEEA